MEKIDYAIRASFEEFSSEDSGFIRRLTERHDIHSILEIPCANGRNLSTIGDAVSLAFFADINPKMLEAVQRKIAKGNRKNCEALLLDMCDLSKIPFDVDTILIMQQSFQMLSAKSGKKALQNLRKTNCRRIVIDIYDFLYGATDLPRFLKEPTSFVDNESNKSWIRKSSVLGSDNNWIHILHEYISDDKTYFSEVNLYNYSRGELISLCKECGHTIADYYTDYSFGKDSALGRTILLIER